MPALHMSNYQFISQYSNYGTKVLSGANDFWDHFDLPVEKNELLRFSMFMGLFAFSGYLFSYTIVGKIWNWWPFVRTTVPVARAIMCAGLQWVFFAVFPMLSSLLTDFLVGRKWSLDVDSLQVIVTYSMTPVYVASLFVGIPFFNRTITFLAMCTFLYLLYFGYRIYLKQSVWRSILLSLIIAFLFSMIRQMFIYVIGF
jgi:hypothetical protein